MALGTNCDYKTADRRVRRVMRLHAGRLQKYAAQGIDRDRASILAMMDLETGRICSTCAGEGLVASGEGARACKLCVDGMTGERTKEHVRRSRTDGGITCRICGLDEAQWNNTNCHERSL